MKSAKGVIEAMSERNKNRDLHNLSFEQLCSVMELEIRIAAQAAIDAVVPKDKSKMKTANSLQDLMLREYNLSRDSVIKAGQKFMGENKTERRK